MKRAIGKVINSMPYIRGLHRLVLKQGMFPAGHYYSPIPAKEEVEAHIHAREVEEPGLPDIDLQRERQLALLGEYRRFHAEIPFPETRTDGLRYYFRNPFFSRPDAVFLYSFLRNQQPRRIIEVGSGFSSAVMLDTIDRFLPNRPEVTFIEPYPDRLLSLLLPEDKTRCAIIPEKVQNVHGGIFSALQSGDLLFVDSSHVLKCGGDLHSLLFHVLPRLPPGVFVHFHDVFYPFDYPAKWLREGRFWNENYFLRAFLSGNAQWEIHFFGNYVTREFGEFLAQNMPMCGGKGGAGLYIRRKIANIQIPR
jgi:hypothetical protein